MTIKSHKFFWFFSAYKSHVFIIVQSIKCVKALCLGNQSTYLNLKIILLEKWYKLVDTKLPEAFNLLKIQHLWSMIN